MGIFSKYGLAAVLVAGNVLLPFAGAAARSKPAFTIHKVTAMGAGDTVELEILASDAVKPHAEMLSNPDRLIIDFLNSVAGPGLHNVAINRGEVKGVRVGMFGSNPIVTRVVVDLSAAQTYQLFPSGKTVIVKLNLRGAKLHAVSMQPVAVSSAPPPPAAKPAPRLEVSFQKGKLSLSSNGATLAEVLQEVRRRTGADITIPGGAEQEQVFANYGPAPAREVLSSLLNGSRFNFVMISSERDPAQLRSVLLLPRGAAIPQPVTSLQPAAVAQVVPEPEPSVEPEPVADTPVDNPAQPASPQPPAPSPEPPQR